MATQTLSTETTASADDLQDAAVRLFTEALAAILSSHGELAISTRQFLLDLLRLRVAHSKEEQLLLLRGVHVLNIRLNADELCQSTSGRGDNRKAATLFARKAQRGFGSAFTLGDPLPPTQ